MGKKSYNYLHKMEITIDQLKQLRETTGVSMQACKDALKETNGDLEKAVDYLRKKGESKAAKLASRETKEGIVASYIHGNKKIGVLVEIQCETDFVARNEEFINFAQDIAMHIAATNPTAISPDEISDEAVAKEREIWAEQLSNEGKPADIHAKIIEGKEKKFREEGALISQPFVKNPELTIEKLVTDMGQKMGENIKISQFTRYEI